VTFPNFFPLPNEFLIEPMNTVRVTMLELRPSNPATVEDLVGRIADLVLERQSLRARGEGSPTLERNRLELVRAHQDLSYALIDRYCPPKAEVAEAAA
jgi:hypothetical protein